MRPTRVSTLVIVAVVFAVAAWLLLRSTYQHLPPLPAAPLFALRVVALAKASSVAAAIIAGLAAGFDIYLSGSLSASVPRQDALTAAVTFVAAVVLACAALYLEYCCRVPNAPDRDDREDAKPRGTVLSPGKRSGLIGAPPRGEHPRPGRGGRAWAFPGPSTTVRSG